MPYSQVVKINARKLRVSGFSYGAISKRLRVPKSTLSLWLKDVPLARRHRHRFYTKQIIQMNRGEISQRVRRDMEITSIIDRAKSEVTLPIDHNTLRYVGAAMYWAEGSKTNAFYITNSDPQFIVFFVYWLKHIFNIEPKLLKARLNIYPKQNEQEIKKYWSRITGIPLARFGKSYVKPPGMGYRKNILYNGTIRIEVPKSTNKMHQVYGWIQGLLAGCTPKMHIAERQWKKLRNVEKIAINMP